jgi:hypothetical protein
VQQCVVLEDDIFHCALPVLNAVTGAVLPSGRIESFSGRCWEWRFGRTSRPTATMPRYDK